MNRGFHCRAGLLGVGRLSASGGLGPDFNSTAYSETVLDTVLVSEALVHQGALVIQLPETVTLEEAFTYPQSQAEVVGETVTLGESLVFRRGISHALVDTVTVDEALSDAASTATPTSAFSIDLAFSVNVRLNPVNDPSRFRILSLGAGVPVGVLSSTPRRMLLSYGDAASIVEDATGAFSHTVYLGIATTVHDRLRITSPWQDLEVEILEDLGGGQARVDKPLILADPANGALLWWYYGGVYGATLRVTETTRNAPYMLLVDGLFSVFDGSPYTARMPFTGLAERPTVVSVGVNEDDGTLLVTFSEPLALDSALFDPTMYSVTGATDVVVQGVRQVSPTQVAVRVIGLASGESYVLSMPLFRDLALNSVQAFPP